MHAFIHKINKLQFREVESPKYKFLNAFLMEMALIFNFHDRMLTYMTFDSMTLQ